MTIDELKLTDLFKVGAKFNCTHSYNGTWRVGGIYTVEKHAGMLMLTSEKTPQAFSVSTFVPICDPDASTFGMDEEVNLSDDEVLTAVVTHPSHYTKYVIEPLTFIMENDFPFWKGNIIKYTSRAGSKLYDGMDAVQSEITDLEKVRRYAEVRINQLKNKSQS